MNLTPRQMVTLRLSMDMVGYLAVLCIIVTGFYLLIGA